MLKLPKFSISENAMLLGLAVAVGVATAGGVWLFRQGFEFFTRVYQVGLSQSVFAFLGVWALVPLLALAGLIVGLIKQRFVGEERHHGVAAIMESVAYSGGRLPWGKVPFKALLASFSIGAGASVGPEDPSVQIGANLGSLLGQRLRLSDDRVRLLVAAGAASGVASAFRAPIAGVFFALEIILGDFSTSSFGVVVLASVIASVFTQAIDAGGPELGIRTYTLGGLQELPFYVLLGLLAAPLAVLFIRTLYWQHDLWHHLKLSPPIKTALAGALVGVIGVFLPQILGTGRETMNALLNQNEAEFGILLLLGLAFVKLIASTISLGGGFVGGMFAPSLFVGAALGGAYGRIIHLFISGNTSADPAAFAMAGMAAMMTGVIRAPITAVLLLFELTNDYTLILPIMLVVAVCLIVVERFAPDGIYQHGLARKGVRLARGRDIDLMQIVTVAEAMSEPHTVSRQTPTAALEAIFDQHQTHGLIVLDEDGLLYGIVTIQDLARAREAERIESTTTAEICTRDVLTTTPEMPIATALHLLGERDLGRLPVVAKDEPRRVVGVLRRRDIMRAYDLALQRKQQEQHRVDQIRLSTLSGAYVVEMRVNSGALVEGQRLREAQWPVGSVIASIWRNGQALAPNGDSRLLAGDRLTIVTTAQQQPALEKLLMKKGGA
jgi:CIC family chloride channel protein